MRITIATGPMLPVPALLGGAIPRMWHGLARAFARHGHAVCVFARSYPGQPDDETQENVRYLRYAGMTQTNRIVVDLAKDFLYAAAAVGRLPAADVLVTNDFWLPVFAGWRAAAGRIVINANRFPKGQFRLYGRAAAIAAASTAVRDEILREVPGRAAEVSVIPNPVDTTLYRPRPAPHDGGTSTLLYCGRLHPEKGVHVLAGAFARIAPRQTGWRLRLVGPWRSEQGGGGEGYLRELHHLLGGTAAEIPGPEFDPQALAREYQGAQLFCYPSLAERGESFGLAALESMACGVAPVVSGLACFRDFVADGHTGWVFDHRAADPVAALAARLESAMGDPAALGRAGENAARAATRFSVENVAAMYLGVFEKLEGP